jgi:hypothetical protein
MTPAVFSMLSSEGGLYRYLYNIRRFPVLKPQQEYMLVKRCRENRDSAAAHQLVTSHLRLLTKIASADASHILRRTLHLTAVVVFVLASSWTQAHAPTQLGRDHLRREVDHQPSITSIERSAARRTTERVANERPSNSLLNWQPSICNGC